MNRRHVLAASVAAMTLVIAPTLAFAHVEVEAEGDAVQGGYASLTFSVPNERDDASVMSVSVKLPDETPIVFALAEPIDGWSAEVTMKPLGSPLQIGDITVTEAVDVVTWNATGAGTPPNEETQFPLMVGPLPLDTAELSFPTVQTYDSGEVVRWIEPMNPDGSEPELPAPELAVAAGSGEYASLPAEFAALVAPTTVPSATEAPATAAPETAVPETAAPETAPLDTVVVIAPAPDSTGDSVVATTASGDDDGGSSAGIIVGVVVAAAVLGAGGVILARRRKAAS